MPKERKKVLCMDAQRHAEYYGVQQTFDELYAKSKAGEVFNGLMELVLSPDNIMLAYRNIKTNTGSYTAGTDKQNIGDIGRLPPAEVIGKVRKIVTGSKHGYRPKPVRRKDIPKPNGKTRPLGIPCIWDRLVQQCMAAFVSGLLLIADMGHNCEKTLGFCNNQLDVPAALKLYNTKFFQNKLKTKQ